jgi:peroxiredoxin Q/BCP
MRAYRDQYAEIFGERDDVVLLAISRDSPEELLSWAQDEGFGFRLLSDADGAVGTAYGAVNGRGDLNNRNLFIVGPDGRIAHRMVPFREVDPTAYTDLARAITALANGD